MSTASVPHVEIPKPASNHTMRFNRRISGAFRLLIALAVIAFSTSNLVPAFADDGAAVVEEQLPEADQMMFAESMEGAVKNSDLKVLNNIIDWDQIIDTATAGESSPVLDRARATFKVGFTKAVKQGDPGTFGEQLIRNSKEGGSLKFLRLSQVDNQPIAVFRLKNAKQGGANYHQYFLKRSADGLVRAHDFYVFLSAERISETVRRIWLPLSVEASKTLIEKFTKPADPIMTQLQSLQTMQRMIANGQGELALNEYRKLPEKAQREKLFLIFRLQAAQQISEVEYGAAIDDFRKHHPGDMALDFILIDGYALQKNFEKSLECIDRTNKSVGGDAFLLTLRANVLARLDRFEEAQAAVSEAMKQEPDLLDAYLSGLGVSLLQKNYADTARFLNMIERDLGQPIVDITKIPDYAEFVKSPEYKKWMAFRK